MKLYRPTRRSHHQSTILFRPISSIQGDYKDIVHIRLGHPAAEHYTRHQSSLNECARFRNLRSGPSSFLRQRLLIRTDLPVRDARRSGVEPICNVAFHLGTVSRSVLKHGILLPFLGHCKHMSAPQGPGTCPSGMLDTRARSLAGRNFPPRGLGISR